MEMNVYQQRAIQTKQKKDDPDAQTIISLLGLAGEAGELISEYKKRLRDGENYTSLTERVGEELGDLLWYVASVADEFGLSLGDIAQANLRKIDDRWGKRTLDPIAYFDSDTPQEERLPQQIRVVFSIVIVNGREKTQMTIEGSDIGDPLTDNAYEDDGYRFHDVFHWACAAMLGWSPVIRKLLRRKRKHPVINEVEDGGRAAAIEEGVSALIFSYAADRGFLDGISRVDSDLLRTIKGMTRHLEVKNASPGDWEKTIIAAFDVWRQISRDNGGSIMVDLASRRVNLLVVQNGVQRAGG